MKWKSLTLFSFLALMPALYPDTIEAGRDIEDNDIRALKEWIDTKRQISLKEIGGNLSLSGEVRTEYQSAWEESNGKKVRGSNPKFALPRNGFDVEFNFMLDYRTDRTWASIKIEYDDDMGVFSGTLNHISLERCYWGVRPIMCDNYTFDIEVGRRSMSTIFDSKVQFASFFDGVLFRYDQAFEKVGDFYLRAGAFVINDKANHFGYIGEIGLLNIAGTGFYGKFSTIDWMTKTYTKKFLNLFEEEERPDSIDFLNDRFAFIVSQWTLGYRFRIECIDKIGILYSAFLWNWAARPIPVSANQYEQWAFYAGVSIGQLRKQWDWAFDANYQIVLPQAIPDYDVSGFTLGNANSSGFYTKKIRPLQGDGPSTVETAAGTPNYHGYIIRFDVLLTDKLDMQQLFVQSWTWDDKVGPDRKFIQYELEFIYSW